MAPAPIIIGIQWSIPMDTMSCECPACANRVSINVLYHIQRIIYDFLLEQLQGGEPHL